MKIDLNLLPLFLAVAQEHNFRAAADRLGVTRSTVSQDPTTGRHIWHSAGDANDAFCAPDGSGRAPARRIVPTFSDIETAFENVSSDNVPRGFLKITVTSIAEQFLSGPLIASFAAANPFVTIDVTVTDDEFDIVAAGYDAESDWEKL